jgi:hypothetical protein
VTVVERELLHLHPTFYTQIPTPDVTFHIKFFFFFVLFFPSLSPHQNFFFSTLSPFSASSLHLPSPSHLRSTTRSSPFPARTAGFWPFPGQNGRNPAILVWEGPDPGQSAKIPGRSGGERAGSWPGSGRERARSQPAGQDPAVLARKGPNPIEQAGILRLGTLSISVSVFICQPEERRRRRI